MTTDTANSKHETQSADRMQPHLKLVIALMLISAFIVVLNETIMSVALPHLMADLNITASTAQWLTTGYLLTMAIVIPISGRIIERFSTRSVFIAAMALFTAGTALAACAPGIELLLAGRVLQAGGTALVLPLLTITVLNAVPAGRRGRMMGLISIVISVAPAVGPTVSGVILDTLSWRWMFIVVAPIAAASLVLGIVLVKNITSPRHVRFDALSVGLSALGFGGVVYGLSGIGGAGSDHSILGFVVPLVAGGVSLALFVFRQLALQRDDRALLNLKPFRTSAFSIGVVLIVISFLVLYGSLILLPIYMQTVVGLDTLQTGLLLLPGGLVMGLAGLVVGRLFDRFGPRPLVIPGAVVLSGAVWCLTTFGVDTPIALVVGTHVLLFLALAFLTTPLMTSALGSLRSELYPHGTAIINTLQQVAGAAGTALFVTLMTTGATGAAARGLAGPAAIQTGVHIAFLCGAFISLVAVGLAFFVKRPVDSIRTNVALH